MRLALEVATEEEHLMESVKLFQSLEAATAKNQKKKTYRGMQT